MQIESHNNNIVKKPWGYEYLVYQDANVALWFLYIAPNQKTSLHSHPKKTTGLIILDGKAQVDFFNNENVLDKLDKIMIRKGMFHSTTSISEHGTKLFEIETPNDKLDLVRLEDSYGREGLPYEDSTYENPKQDDCLWLENLSIYKNQQISFSDCKLTILNVKNITELTCLDSQKNVMILTGGIVTDYEVLIVCPGDIVKIEILQKIETVFNKVKENTFVILFENLD
jgi:mannose-6-phosphate isomerase-like protein (cupin superfamily)